MLANKQKAMIKNNVCLLQPPLLTTFRKQIVMNPHPPSPPYEPNPFSIEYAFVAFKQIYFVHTSLASFLFHKLFNGQFFFFFYYTLIHISIPQHSQSGIPPCTVQAKDVQLCIHVTSNHQHNFDK